MVLIEDIDKFYNYFQHDNKTEIRVFDAVKYPEGKSLFVSNLEDFKRTVQNYQKEGVDVFIGFRDRKAKGDKNTTSSECIFFEIDEHDIKKPEQKEKVEALLKEKGIEIGMSGLSGGGFHYYIPHKRKYLFSDEDRIFYQKILKAFKDALLKNNIDVDPKVFNLERVSRVLGTMNFKRKTQSKILIYNPDIDRKKNHQAMKNFIFKYEKEEKKVDEDAVKLLEKYGINKSDKWFYDIIKNNIQVKEDTGGNSVVFKNCAIVLTRENIPDEEIRVIGKALADLTEGRTLSAFIGWVRKCYEGDLAEVCKPEVNQFIQEGGYNLTEYKEDKLSSMKEDVEYAELNVKDFSYFKKLKKPKHDLIESIVPKKSLAVGYAPPKQNKSLIELEKCICLSSGRKFLGHFKTKKTNCLYVDLENNEFIIKDRWEKLRKAHNIRSNKGLYFLSRDSRVNIMSVVFMDRLKDTIKKYKIGYIVIDTLPKATDYDSNSEREVNKIYTQFFKPLIEEFDCSITFLLHTNKSGSSFIGSQAYHGIVDCSYEINKKKGTNKVHVKSDNRIANINFGVEFEFTEDEIRTYMFDVEQEKVQAVSKIKELTEKVKGYFNQSSRLQRKDIEIRLEDDNYSYGRATLTRVLKFLYESEYLDKDNKGVYWMR